MRKNNFLLLALVLIVYSAYADIRVNDDAVNSWQGYPAIDCSNTGFGIAWQYETDDSSKIFLQFYDSLSVGLGSNIELLSDKYRSLPAISHLADSTYLMVWAEEDSIGWHISGQKIYSNGNYSGSVFQINDTSYEYCFAPAAASNHSSSRAVVWMNLTEGIAGQIYDQSGGPVGTNIAISETTGADPKICMSPSGGFAVVWQGEDSEEGNILWRRFGSTGIPAGATSRLNARDVILDYAQPIIAVNDSGNYCMAWTRTTASGAAIMAQFCDSSGAAIGANVVVNQDTLIWGGHPTVVPVADNHFVIGWTDERDWVDNYCQRFSNCNQPEGNNVRISSVSASGERYRQSLVLSSNGSNIVGAWMDLRDTSMSWDIYERSIDYEALGVAVLPGDINNILSDRLTTKCWPNPGGGKFNIKCATNILKGNIKLSIYNNCGQIVKTETIRASSSGQNIFVWKGRNNDGKKVSQGVYFYKISLEDNSAFGKIILVR
jgi:hypothetical protein